MHHVRGNHDAMISDTIAATAPFTVELSGVTLAVLDTVRPGAEHGRIPREQLVWLEDLASASTAPLLVFGHHHPWDPSSTERNEHYFGINPDDSEALCGVITRCESIAGYFAGHTHRNRVRHFDAARRVPIVEVACVKDYPGAWAEYRVHEGGYAQLVRRIATPTRNGVDRADARDVRGALPRLRARSAKRPLFHPRVVVSQSREPETREALWSRRVFSCRDS